MLVPWDKHLLRLSSMRKRMGSATMSLAIKAIGDSLMTPLDLNISPPPKASDLDLSDLDYKKRNIFRFPSIKKGFMSKSHGYIAGIGDSFEMAAMKSSMQSLGKSDQESDVKEFQKELINLPIYEVDTHRMDQSASPLISRSNSVPEHLAHLHDMGLDNLASFHLRGSQRRKLFKPKRSTESADLPQDSSKQCVAAATIREPQRAGSTTWTNSSMSKSGSKDENMAKCMTPSASDTFPQTATPVSLHLTLPVPGHSSISSIANNNNNASDTIIVHFAAATPLQ